MIKTLIVDWDIDEAGENSEYILSLIGDTLGEYSIEENLKYEDFAVYVDTELGLLLSNIDIEGSLIFHGDRDFIDDLRKELDGQLSSADTPIHLEEDECFEESVLNFISKNKP